MAWLTRLVLIAVLCLAVSEARRRRPSKRPGQVDPMIAINALAGITIKAGKALPPGGAPGFVLDFVNAARTFKQELRIYKENLVDQMAGSEGSNEESNESLEDELAVTTAPPDVFTDGPTDFAEEVTEEPEVVTEEGLEPTDEPEVTDELSEEVTEGPDDVTDGLEVTDEAVVTDEPEVTDEAVETDEPEVVTDTPEVTDEPELATEEPEPVTESLEIATDAPSAVNKRMLKRRLRTLLLELLDKEKQRV